jgi:hypothetical protein
VSSELLSLPVVAAAVAELLVFLFFTGFEETVPGTANPMNSQLQLSQSK